MEKDISKILEELGFCPDFKTFYRENQDYMVTDSLSALSGRLLQYFLPLI